LTDNALAFDRQSATSRGLAQAIENARCVAICGIPGVGKSVLVRELMLLAVAARRGVHLLQWDVARLPFDQPAILDRYPEIDNVTHPILRRSAGLWARTAIAAWFKRHADPNHLLVIEAPLVGNRFMELARPASDEAEPHLAAAATQFLVPIPTCEVRAAIERARANDSRDRPHVLNAKDAPPALVDALWRQVLSAAEAFRLPNYSVSFDYAPSVYRDVYRRVLRHRHLITLSIEEVIRVPQSAHELPAPLSRLVPNVAEVERWIQAVESEGVANAVSRDRDWFKV